MYYKRIIVGYRLLIPCDRECSPEVPIYKYVPVRKRKKPTKITTYAT